MQHMKVILFATCLLACVAPAVAHAEGSGRAASGSGWDSSRSTPDEHEEAPYRKSKPEPRRRWYGHLTLLADGLSVALIAGGLAIPSAGMGIAGAVGFVLVSPMIHTAHGQVVPAMAGLPLRAVALVGGLVVGFASSRCGVGERLDSCQPEAVTHWIVGAALGAALIDAAFLAYEPLGRRQAGGHWVPRLVLGRGEGALILQRAF